MFKAPKKHYKLMTEYTELVISGLKRKYKILLSEQIEQKLLQEFHLIEEKYIEDMDYELSSFDSIESFIESRIGEDFVVLDGFEDYVFCIHEMDDFITQAERFKIAPSEKKQFNMKDLNENKLAA